MKRSKFIDSQMIDALKQVDTGLVVPEVYRELAIRTVIFYKWRAKYGGMDTSMMARMDELKTENARLKEDVHLREANCRHPNKPRSNFAPKSIATHNCL